MKITVITQYYKPEMGALQNRLYEMCSGLQQLGVEMSIYTSLSRHIRMATDVQQRETMRAHCKECAQNKFNRPKQISKLYDFLQRYNTNA